MTAEPEAPSDLDGMTFEQLLAALEGLTARMAAGDIGIEEATDLYERAERLHHAARERLDRVQARIDARAAPPVEPEGS